MVILIDVTPPSSPPRSLSLPNPELIASPVDQEYAKAIADLFTDESDIPNLELDDVPQTAHSRSTSDGTIKHGNEVGTYVDVEVQTDGLGESTSSGAQSLDDPGASTPTPHHNGAPTHQESFATFYTCACPSEGHNHDCPDPKATKDSVDPSKETQKPIQANGQAAPPSHAEDPGTSAHAGKEGKTDKVEEVTPKETKPPNPSTSNPAKNNASSNTNDRPKPPTPTPTPPPPTPPKPTGKVAAVTHKIADTISAMESQYMNMLLALDKIPPMYTLLANFFTWILLAGFLLFPGTFTSLQTAQDTSSNEVERKVLSAITHVPLFVLAFICCGIGTIGMCWLWWRWKKNYIWVTEKIFMPGLMNSVAGIITTLSSVFGAQGGQFSKPSKITIITTSTIAVVCGILVVVYQFYFLRMVKQRHDEEIGEAKTGKHGEGVLDRSKIAAKAG